MGYLRPVDAPISASWQDHKNRNPPSGEPGVDYACSYGTIIIAAGNGVIADLTYSNGGGTGRFVAIDLDDGKRIRYLHLSDIYCSVGDRVVQGQGIAVSGASGYGNDWHYGPHVHATLFPEQWYDWSNTLDFELYLEDDVDKQDVKDAMFEFYRDVNSFPPGHPDWPFVQQAVWKAPLPAQDENGNPIYDGNGKPVTFDAQGFAASTNAQIGAIRNELYSVSSLNRWVYSAAGLITIVNLILLGILVAN